MDLYERYSEEDINSAKEFLEMTVDEQGLEKLLKIYKRSIDIEKFLEKYEKDRKEECINNNIQSIKPSSFTDKVLGAIIPKSITTEKLEPEEEEKLRLENIELQKIRNIIQYDKDMQEFISDTIENLDYDEGDIKSRMENVKTIIDFINIIDNYKYFPSIYNALNNKLKQFTFNDFALSFVSVNTREFFKNPYFKETILDKINSISDTQLIYLNRTTTDGMDGHVPEIVDAKNKKLEKTDNLVMAESFIKSPKDYGKFDSILSLYYKSNDNKMEIYKNLTDTEFMRLLLMYKNKYAIFDPELLNSEVTSKKLSELSNKNIILLSETYYNEYEYYLEYGINNEEKGFMKENAQWSFVFDEAQKRGLISKDFKKMYGKKDQEKAFKSFNIYKELNSDYSVPCEFIYFNTTLREEDEDIDDRSSEEILIERFSYANQKLNAVINSFNDLEKLVNMPDINILQEANRYNIKYKKEGFPKEPTKLQSFTLNYMKKRILGMKPYFANYFQVIDGGIFNDVMTLKIEELQKGLPLNLNEHSL